MEPKPTPEDIDRWLRRQIEHSASAPDVAIMKAIVESRAPSLSDAHPESSARFWKQYHG
jgi:hypothetical protein